MKRRVKVSVVQIVGLSLLALLVGFLIGNEFLNNDLESQCLSRDYNKSSYDIVPVIQTGSYLLKIDRIDK